MKKLSKKRVFIVLLVIIGIFLCPYGFTFAKYVSSSIWDYYLKSKGFYFASDFLGSTATKNVNNLWNGESVHFNIKNYLNQAVIADYDIGYRIVCTIEGDAAAYTACNLDGTSSNIEEGILPKLQACRNSTGDNVDVSLFDQTTCEAGGYDWISLISTKDLYFDVILTDTNYQLTDVVVNLTVTSTSPYHKALAGTFTLHKSIMEEDKLTMNYKNYSDYGRLTVSNSYADSKCVRVTWDTSKLLINEDISRFSLYNVDSNGYINEIKFNIGGKSNLSYKFYRKDFDIQYSTTDFSIEETSGC